MKANPNTLFEDSIRFAGLEEDVEVEFATLKTYDNFETYFPEDVERIRAVTYSESPGMLLDVFDSGIGTLHVIVGDKTKDYREQLRGKEREAARLERLQRAGDLEIHLTATGHSDLHSKLYIIEHGDGSRTNIVGSPNLSRNGWSSTRQKNIAVVFYTDGDQQLDAYFEEWYAEHLAYADLFMEDLTEEVEGLPEDERRERVYAFIDGRQTSETETAEYQQAVTKQLDNVPIDRIGVLGGFEDEDDVDFTTSIVSDGGADVKIRPTLAGYEDVQESLREGTRHMDDVRISEQRAEMPAGVASQYTLERFGAPKMWRSDADGALVLQRPDGKQQELMRAWDDPGTLDAALACVEEYVETVNDHGNSGDKPGVKAQMYEALLWFFWAPFAEEYAREYDARGIGLDKFLPGLYIFGETNSGKGTLATYAQSLLSDGAVTDLMDGDGLGKRKLRAARQVDSRFPIVFDDIEPKKIDNETYLNYRDKHWAEGGASIPSLAFISNNSLPNHRLQKRLKTLHLSVQFESAHRQAQYVNDLIDRPNPIFALFAEEFATRAVAVPEHSNDTLAEARRVVGDMYEFAGRTPPTYVPLGRPAEIEHDTGKRVWQNAVDAGNVAFDTRGGNLIATFDSDFSKYRARTYERALPTSARASAEGRTVVVKEPETALEWFTFDPSSKKGLLERLLSWN